MPAPLTVDDESLGHALLTGVNPAGGPGNGVVHEHILANIAERHGAVHNAPLGPTRGVGSRRPADADSLADLPGSSVAADGFTIESATEPRSFGSLWPDMSSLASGHGARAYPFQCRDHLEIWLETIGTAARVQPFLSRVSDAEGRPLMFVPLGLRIAAGVRVLEFLDCGVADYNAPVLFRAALGVSPLQMQAIWKALCRAAPPFDIAMLTKMPEVVADFANPFHTLGTGRWPHSGHVIRLGGDLSKLKSGDQRRDSQRRRRRLAELGPVLFRIASEPREIARTFEIFLRQKSAHYRETLGTDGFDVPGQIAYYRILTERLSGRGVQLASLSVGEEIVATVWSLLAGGRLYYMMPAYARGKWRAFSPGRLLLEDLAAWALDSGFEALDLGIGDEDYKLRWKQTELALAQRLQPVTTRGYAYRAALAAREVLRDRLPVPLRRAAKALLLRAGPARAQVPQ